MESESIVIGEIILALTESYLKLTAVGARHDCYVRICVISVTMND